MSWKKKFVRNWGRLGMKYNKLRFDEITLNYDKKRIPLSAMERTKRQGAFRYFGAQGVIDYVDDYIFDGKYLLIAEDGENLKSKRQNIAQIVEGKFWVNNHAHIVQCNEMCILEYLAYLINSKDVSGYITGSAQPKLSQANLNAIEFDIPSIKEQQDILSILLPIEQKIRINNEINNNLEQQIEALLLQLINDDNTSEVALGDYLYIKGRIGWKGLKKSEYLSKSGYRIINGETLTKSGIDWNKAGYISSERYEESPEIMLKVSDILLSKDGTIGKIGYVDSLDLPTSVASGIFVIRNNQPNIVSTTFIYYLLKSQLFKAFIATRTEGSVIPHLYQKDFMEFKFPLPASDKMMTFEEIAEPMFSQIISNLNENKKLTSLRDVILPKLMSGELDVSNLNL